MTATVCKGGTNTMSRSLKYSHGWMCMYVSYAYSIQHTGCRFIRTGKTFYHSALRLCLLFTCAMQ